MYVEKKNGTAKVEANADGTVTAVGYFEIDNNLTDVKEWGQEYFDLGSKMMIRENGSGVYYISNSGHGDKLEYFGLVNQDGKTYIEMTNKEQEDGVSPEGCIPKGTRFLVEAKEVGNNKYLYVHNEDNNDIMPGNKYWKLIVDGYSVFEPINEEI